MSPVDKKFFVRDGIPVPVTAGIFRQKAIPQGAHYQVSRVLTGWHEKKSCPYLLTTYVNLVGAPQVWSQPMFHDTMVFVTGAEGWTEVPDPEQSESIKEDYYAR